MRINLVPQCCSDTLSVSKSGDVLTINGEQFDFSLLPEGATVPAGSVPCKWVLGDVERFDGEIVLTLLMPHASAAPRHVRFPAPIIDPPDGGVVLPTSEAFNVDA